MCAADTLATWVVVLPPLPVYDEEPPLYREVIPESMVVPITIALSFHELPMLVSVACVAPQSAVSREPSGVCAGGGCNVCFGVVLIVMLRPRSLSSSMDVCW